MNTFLTTLLLTSLIAGRCIATTQPDGNNSPNRDSLVLFEKPNTNLILSNPTLGGRFLVTGTLYFYEKSMVFHAYSDSAFLTSAHRVYGYNHLIKDFEIPYIKIKKVCGGFFFYLHRKVVVRLDKKIKYKFITSHDKDRKEIVNFIRSKSG